MKKVTDLKMIRRRIEKNYQFMKCLEKLVPIQKSDLDKLKIISLIAKMYAEYVTGVYSSEFLEKEIIKIGKRNIFFTPKKQLTTGNMLHVMTKSAWVGGHSVIVNNWIKWDDTHSYSLVFTDMEYMDIPDFLKESVRQSGGKIYCLHGNYFEKAQELLDISQEYERIILSTHMEDVVPVLAFSNSNWHIPVYFYNHADFRFSLGFSVADAVFNLNMYDQKKTKIYRGITNSANIVFQFPGMGKIERNEEIDKAELKKSLIKKYNIDESKKIIVSMGADFKYENIIGFEFDSFAKDLVDKCNNQAAMYIVGADRNRDKWICLENKTSGKVRAMGILPREDAEGLIQIADLFIVSFPMKSSGVMVAEAAGVPYLALHVINRGSEQYGTSSAKTIEELIEKSLEALFVNPHKYLGTCRENRLSKKEWVERWNCICNSITFHKLHKFCNNRLVKRQEYVNCQLMQEEAGKNVSSFIKSELPTYRNIRKIFVLSKCYDMGVFSSEESSLFKLIYEDYQEKAMMSKKYLHLYLVTTRWLKLKIDGKKISDYLLKYGYKQVAIYGMNYIGKILADELKDSSIQVSCGIDRNAKFIYSKIPVCLPSDELDNIDLIINTAVASDEEVRSGLNDKNVKIISLERIMDVIES